MSGPGFSFQVMETHGGEKIGSGNAKLHVPIAGSPAAGRSIGACQGTGTSSLAPSQQPEHNPQLRGVCLELTS